MITGKHAIVFSPEAEKVRAFFADVIGLLSADAGEGWLIFALPRPSLPFTQLTVRAVTSPTSCATTFRPPSPS